MLGCDIRQRCGGTRRLEMAEGVEVGLRLASRMHGGDLNEASVENVGEFHYGVFESFAIG